MLLVLARYLLPNNGILMQKRWILLNLSYEKKTELDRRILIVQWSFIHSSRAGRVNSVS